MLLNREGRFVAQPTNVGIRLKGSEQVEVSIAWDVQQMFANGEWFQTEQPEEITSYTYLMKKDGNVNENGFDQLHKAFPNWPSNDPLWLEEHAKELPEAQITTKFESYTNKNSETKTSLKVTWLDNRDSEGSGVVKSTPETRKAISSLFGSKFRALPKPVVAAAAKPATLAAKPVTPPVAKPSAAARSATPKVPECTMDEAWADFSAKGNELGHSEENVTNAFWNQVGEMFEKTSDQAGEITGAQWARLKAAGFQDLVF